MSLFRAKQRSWPERNRRIQNARYRESEPGGTEHHEIKRRGRMGITLS